MKNLLSISINEICVECGVPMHLVELFIEQEWITPLDQNEKLFDEEDIARITLICELRDELGVNDESMPIILKLLDQLHYLRMMVNNANQDL
ncbi:MAG TPA: chaperone modulator CbpM [Bacteriovoracaceae bacterium]|nr:chaperone modulator CbpM [Bacteriovoracaceae bacterium]